MRQFLIIFRCFVFLGVLQSIYSTKNSQFYVKKSLISYTVVLTFLIEAYVILEAYINNDSIALLTFGNHTTDIHLHWFIKYTLLLHFTNDLIINLNTVITLLLYRQKHNTLLNELLDKYPHESPHTNKSRVFRTFLILMFNHFIAFPLYRLLQIGVSWLAFTRLIAVNFHSVQYEFGHLYEMFVIEELKIRVEALSLIDENFQFRNWVEEYSKVMKIVEKTKKLFEVNKIVCLACINFLLSFCFFYDLDRIDNENMSYMHWMTIFLRQSMFGMVLVVCNEWHRLIEQVSD